MIPTVGDLIDLASRVKREQMSEQDTVDAVHALRLRDMGRRAGLDVQVEIVKFTVPGAFPQGAIPQGELTTWRVRVRTDRGTVEHVKSPGETWADVAEAVGLGGKV